MTVLSLSCDRFLRTQYDTTIETYSTLDYNSILTVDWSTRKTLAGSVDPPNPRHALKSSVDSSSAAWLTQSRARWANPSRPRGAASVMASPGGSVHCSLIDAARKKLQNLSKNFANLREHLSDQVVGLGSGRHCWARPWRLFRACRTAPARRRHCNRRQCFSFLVLNGKQHDDLYIRKWKYKSVK